MIRKGELIVIETVANGYLVKPLRPRPLVNDDVLVFNDMGQELGSYEGGAGEQKSTLLGFIQRHFEGQS